jgi:hypothetical protein
MFIFVSSHSKRVRIPLSHSSQIAERLLAHARLCRQIAGASSDETTAAKLEQLAEECERAAAGAGPGISANGPIH